jgi:hypothetical protein
MHVEAFKSTKKAAGGVGVAGSNPVVPTSGFIRIAAARR